MDGSRLRVQVGRFADLALRGRGPPVLLDPEICMVCFGPPGRAGPLRPAVADSMILGLFRPVLFGDGVPIDGGAMNPLPYDRLKTVPGASFAPRINSQPLMTIFPDRCP